MGSPAGSKGEGLVDKMPTWERAEQLLDQAITHGVIPGAACAVGCGNQMFWRTTKGMAVVQGAEPRSLSPDDWFDLASLTKVVATLPSLLSLAAAGRVSFADPVSRFLPEWGPRWDAVTLHQLLTHSGGLVPHRDYFVTKSGLAEYLEAIGAEPWDSDPGTVVSYSDLGYITLGAIVERVSDRPLDQFVQETVLAPLGIDAGYRPSGVVQARCAATELEEGHALIGVVHDENARALDGVAGHAGLFAPLDAIVRYAMSWTADEVSFLPRSVRESATRLYTGHLNGRRGWGWSLRGDGYDVGGDFWPVTGAGHTGFTGTSIQIDPVSGLWAVLLTNRVHFGRGININGLRRALHNIVISTVS